MPESSPGKPSNSFGFFEASDYAELPAAARSVAFWSEDAPNPLIILGESGTGKSILLHKIQEMASRNNPHKNIITLTDRDFYQIFRYNDKDLDWKLNASFQELLLNEQAGHVDLVLVDGVPENVKEDAHPAFWRLIGALIKRNVLVVITLSSLTSFPSDSSELNQELHRRAAVIEPRLRGVFQSRAEEAVAELRRLDIRRMPRQSEIAPRFDPGRHGPITVAQEPAPSITAEKSELYEELLLKVRYCLDSCPRESNRTARLRGMVESLLEYLPTNLVEVQPRRLWSRANTLRRHRDADLRLRRSKDPEELPLPELAAELLSDLVEQFNLFAFHDDVLRQLDAASLGPLDRAEMLAELEAGRLLTRALFSAPQIADASAAEILREATEQAASASQQPGINADQAINQALETERNGAIAILTRAVAEVKKRAKSVEDGALKFVGAEATKFVFTKFVQLYEAQISTLLGRINGGAVVAHILRLLRQITGL